MTQLTAEDKRLRNLAVSRAKQRLAVSHANEYRKLLVEECERVGVSAPKEHGTTKVSLELELKIQKLTKLLQAQKIECDFCGWDEVDGLEIGSDKRLRCSVHTCKVCRGEGYARAHGDILCDHHEWERTNA
jgi:hypothetical protein